MLTELVPVGLEIRPDHILEVRGEVSNVVVEIQMRMLCQEIVKLWNCCLKLVSVLELSNNRADFPLTIVGRGIGVHA